MSSATCPIYSISLVLRDLRRRFAFHLVAIFCALAVCQTSYAQSTFGTVLGIVRDPSGSIVPKANVELTNTGTNAIRTVQSGNDGGYTFTNVDVGTYRLSADATGFQKTEYQPFDMAARDSKRIDISLQVAAQASTVTVEAVATIQTEVSNNSESKGSLELTDLPVSIFTRSQGSTSAFSTLTAQPGVQTDSQNNITVAGASPSQLSITIDGISAGGPGESQGGAVGVSLAELFPSFNAIEEIKISETLNPAEYGGVADITTVSKSGTNEFHGGLFENVQNTDFNASDTFSHLQTPVKLNDFGAYLGGPVIIPKVYNGRNKTFFFGSYEVLRLPKSQTEILSVPTEQMRNGDLSAYFSPTLATCPVPNQNPCTANQLTGFNNNMIPASMLNPYSQKLLSAFYPLPNYGPPGAVSNNYLASYEIPINSAQGDIRVDEFITPKHLVYARYTYKNRRVTDVPRDFPPSGGQGGNPSSPLVGNTSKPELYNALAVAYNWIISSSVVNELRGGFSRVERSYNFPDNAQTTAQLLGLTSPPLPNQPAGENIPAVTIAGFLGIDTATADINPKQSTTQFLDTLSWTKGKHSMKFGGDFRYLTAAFTNVFQDYQMGNYTFNGSVTSGLLGSGSATPIAAFLLGYPDLTAIASVINPTTDAYSRHWAFFAQDDWKISSSFTLNYGLRWEYHPGFWDSNNNVCNWDPNYTSVVDGVTEHGAVILPNQKTFANVNPAFVESIAPTPIILASQVGVPSDLRFSSKKDFAPRIGFAYRIGSDNKTVLRGGYGRFIEALQSGTAINGWSVESSSVGYFTNSIQSNGTPMFSLPYSFPSNTAQPGTQFFDLATALNYKDPIVEEWDLTLERDLGKGIGIKASYDGNHSYNIPTLVNTNQIHANTLGFDDPQSQASIPFPQVAYIDTATNQGFGNYQAGTISVHKHMNGLEFEASYAFTRNLTNAIGASNSSGYGYATEFGNTLSDPYNPGLDYGNVPYSRRHRFLATFLYELPFGKGKPFLNSSNGVTDRVLGGWVLSGIAVIQSGPFLTVGTLSDPSGTGFNQFNANGGRADTVPGVSPYAGQSLSQWINPNAFADPCALCGIDGNPPAIGRFGDSQEGAVVGPGTKVLSMSLLKRIPLTESVRLEFGAQVSNLTNHPNYLPPSVLTVGVGGFGAITAMQNAEGAGPRQMQLTGRLTF